MRLKFNRIDTLVKGNKVYNIYSMMDIITGRVKFQLYRGDIVIAEYKKLKALYKELRTGVVF